MLQIDYVLIAEGQVCMEERSRFDRNTDGATNLKLPADYDEIEECAQYCKSISNRFAFGNWKECYCHTGTREAGRCRLTPNADFNLYEFRYPGKLFRAL